jgi:hypothetical protein
MDHTRSRRSEPGKAMRVDGDIAVRALLHPGGREPGKSGADALAGRAVHPHALLWGASDVLLAGGARVWGEREAGAAADAADGTGSHLPKTAAVGACARTPHLPLPSAGGEDRSTEPGLGQRHQCAAASSIGDERRNELTSRTRLAGAGCKPPQAAWAKSPGRERCGKGATRHQVRTNEGEHK